MSDFEKSKSENHSENQGIDDPEFARIVELQTDPPLTPIAIDRIKRYSDLAHSREGTPEYAYFRKDYLGSAATEARMDVDETLRERRVEALSDDDKALRSALWEVYHVIQPGGEGFRTLVDYITNDPELKKQNEEFVKKGGGKIEPTLEGEKAQLEDLDRKIKKAIELLNQHLERNKS